MITLTGIDSGYAWPITDADGQPADLTGWTVLAQVREKESPGVGHLLILAAGSLLVAACLYLVR